MHILKFTLNSEPPETLFIYETIGFGDTLIPSGYYISYSETIGFRDVVPGGISELLLESIGFSDIPLISYTKILYESIGFNDGGDETLVVYCGETIGLSDGGEYPDELDNSFYLKETIGFNDSGYNYILNEHDITFTWRTRTADPTYGYGATEYGNIVSYGDGLPQTQYIEVLHTLTNPGAETGDTTGWTNETGSLAVRTGSPDPYSGSYYFYGGANVETIASQEIDLITDGVSATDIDNEILYFNLSAYCASYSESDQGQLIIRYKDNSKVEISTDENTLSSVTPDQTWVKRGINKSPIPANTRYIDVILRCVRIAGTNNDAYFDDIECYTCNDSNTLTHFEIHIWKFDGPDTNRWLNSDPVNEFEDRLTKEVIFITDSDDPDLDATYTLTVANNKSLNGGVFLYDIEAEIFVRRGDGVYSFPKIIKTDHFAVDNEE